MKASIIFFIVVMLCCIDVDAARLHTERYYQDIDCQSRGGQAEYILPDRTRVDCLTEDAAIEHDFATKWYECITQSMHYAMQTGTRSVCVLILENDTDVKYFHRARRLISHYGLPVDVFTIYENEQ